MSINRERPNEQDIWECVTKIMDTDFNKPGKTWKAKDMKDILNWCTVNEDLFNKCSKTYGTNINDIFAKGCIDAWENSSKNPQIIRGLVPLFAMYKAAISTIQSIQKENNTFDKNEIIQAISEETDTIIKYMQQDNQANGSSKQLKVSQKARINGRNEVLKELKDIFGGEL